MFKLILELVRMAFPKALETHQCGVFHNALAVGFCMCLLLFCQPLP